VSFIRIANGAQPSTIQFHRLEGVEDLAALLNDSVSVRTSSFDTYMDDSLIPATTKKQLLDELDQTFKKPDDPNDPAP
jgi:hypothetical protein